MPRGSCLCGTVTWQVDADLSNLLHCHCSYCRKSHGAAFATYTSADVADFEWTSGEDHLGSYAATSHFSRNFCNLCGSTMPFEENGRLSIPAGTMTEPCLSVAAGHIFVESVAPFYRITDALRQYPTLPDTMARAPANELPRDDEGELTGSCLCNAVAFRCLQAPLGMMNCHCDRCKRSRSAAHATNLFVDAADFEWIRGEAFVENYKLPEAKRFGSAFCRRCGSLMPRVNPGNDRINIPAGCLDKDPGIRPRAHIYVANKANWFNITDDLEQFTEGLR